MVELPALVNGMGDRVRGRDYAEFEIPMSYDGKELSKNNLFHAGDRRKGMSRVAKDWKSALVDSVRACLMSERNDDVQRGLHAFVPVLPVEVHIRAIFENKRNSLDPQNLMELVADAVEEAIGINDRYFFTATYPSQFAPLAEHWPTIYVTVRATKSAR